MLRGLMTDEEWAIVEPFITTPSLRGERPPANHRRVLDDILWICRAGAPWRDLPEAFGNWNSIWRQFRRWCESGVWDVLLQGLADSGRELDALQMIDSTTIRAHRCAAGKKPGSNFRHLAVLAAGSPPKSISAANAVGRPVGVVLTAGESHDVTAYDAPMEQRDSDPGAMLADKGYDSDAIRHDLQDRGTAPEIPTKSNRKVQHSVSKRLYRLRSRIECCIGHLKEQRRVATRYDKTTTIFLGFVLLGCIRLWIRFVHRA